MMGLSVVPGLPKRYSTPWAARVSISTRRPRMPRPSGPLERGHHALGEQLDGAQHLGLLHARPLDAEDEAVDSEGIDIAAELADCVVGIADDEAVLHQLVERQIEAVALRQRLVLAPGAVGLVLGLE